MILCWQEGSDSEKDTKEPEVIARKFKKIPKTKVLVDSSRDDAKRKPAGSSHGCLSLLKKQGDAICSLANYILEMKSHLERFDWVLLVLVALLSE